MLLSQSIRLVTRQPLTRPLLLNRQPHCLTHIARHATAIDPSQQKQQHRGTKFKPITAPTMGEIPKLYKELSKAKLACLVALTTMCGFAMAPGQAALSTLLYTTAGTTLCISSANAFNQWIEIPYDAQMLRTRNRVLGRRALSSVHAFSFGTLTGAAGVTMLSTMVNPLTAALGAANIFLYTCVYTPMKRASIANTWVGAVVGAIPPMMGWTAMTNGLEPGAWVLGALLYAWQFPHFNSLAWNLRADYSKAGYRMMSVTDPKLNARVSLRYSLAMFPICIAMPYLDMTSWLFAADSSIVNAGLAYQAYKFWKDSNEKTARQLFFGSLIHISVLMALMMVHKTYDTSMSHPLMLDDEEDEEEYALEEEQGASL
ncbi:protoheme IX farnesyltransferase [Lichtheimia ornata]|uniref:Protoheme IX farnesyltransferase, mitochondrial n=1 Tax=Lichtheimia ornata TaxID=688661 RepID=A0AAD7UVT3_9FUNG|nr:protoheme IX farnesyltransferase [Lichtheimia ornata]KAJ8653612.1 protoheme IX farnesyltransferase [Lichtheimia ornata]